MPMSRHVRPLQISRMTSKRSFMYRESLAVHALRVGRGALMPGLWDASSGRQRVVRTYRLR